MKELNYILFIFLTLGVFFDAHGASTPLAVPAADTVEYLRHRDIDPLTVTGAGQKGQESLTVTGFDSTMIKDVGTGNISDLLARYSTVFINTYGMGSPATISFRGTSSSHTGVYWNNIPVNNPASGIVDLSRIPVNFADRLELLHGAGSLTAGTGGLGGAVLIKTLPDFNNRFAVTASQSVGEYGFWHTYATASAGNEKVYGRVRFARQKADNDFRFRNTALEDFPRVKNTRADYEKYDAGTDIYFNAGDHNSLSASVWFSSADRSIPPTMPAYNVNREESQDNDDIKAAFNWNMYKGNFSGEFTAGTVTSRLKYRLETNPGTANPFLNESSRNSELTLYSKYTVSYKTEKLRFGGGISYRYDKVKIKDRRRGTSNNPGRDELMTYLSATFTGSERLSAFTLLNLTAVPRKDDVNFIPAAGLSYRPMADRRLTFRVNGARNYHRPTLNDLFWVPGGNPDLRSERGYTVDMGAEINYTFGYLDFRLSLTGFGSWIDDWIVWTQGGSISAAGNGSYWTPENRKKVFSRGVEFLAAVTYSNGRFSATAGMNYGLTKATNEKTYHPEDLSIGKQLVYVPLHKSNVYLDMRYRSWYTVWSWSYVSQRYLTTSNERTVGDLKPYDLHNALFGHELGIVRGLSADIQLRINNVFSRSYKTVAWRAMPHRNFCAAIVINFNK